MTRKKVMNFVKVMAGRVRGLLWPVTKAKLHRLLHVSGVVLTGWIMWKIYRLTGNLGLPTDEHIAISLSPLIPLATKWQAVIRWVDRNVVNELPIPDGESEEHK